LSLCENGLPHLSFVRIYGFFDIQCAIAGNEWPESDRRVSLVTAGTRSEDMTNNMSYRTIEVLYLVNAALLITHEIDSAYWNEWDLLHLPGGIQLFLILNLGLVLLVLFGLRELIQRRRSGLWFSAGLAGAGILAFAIHCFFLIRGHPEFRLPISLAVLGASLVVSLIQGTAAWKLLVRGDADAP
jgi:hypothetical protein